MDFIAERFSGDPVLNEGALARSLSVRKLRAAPQLGV